MGPWTLVLNPCSQPSGIALSNGDSATVGPLQQRNEILSADPKPLTNGGRHDGTLVPQVIQDPGKLLQGLLRVIAVPLHGFDPPARSSQPEKRLEIAVAGRMLQLGHSGRTEMRPAEDAHDTIDFRVPARDLRSKARQADQAVAPTKTSCLRKLSQRSFDHQFGLR